MPGDGIKFSALVFLRVFGTESLKVMLISILIYQTISYIGWKQQHNILGCTTFQAGTNQTGKLHKESAHYRQ
jgi:hypothetical protein